MTEAEKLEFEIMEKAQKLAALRQQDGGVEVSDAIYVINFLFAGGPQPVAPFPDCGVGGTREQILGCLEGCF